MAPNGRTAYDADTGYVGHGNVDVVDLVSHRVVRSVTVGEQPAGLALSSNGQLLYVAIANLYLLTPHSSSSGEVEVINTSNAKLVASISVGMAPLFVSLSPNGHSLAVGDYGSDAITLVNLASLGRRTYPMPGGAFGVAFSPDGSSLYVTGGSSSLLNFALVQNTTSNTVSVVSVSTGRITRRIHVPSDPTDVAVAGNGLGTCRERRLGSPGQPCTQL
ncbi:MAG: YncE family protein [Acidimicrobiales bacterium]